jgi:hypothetical protein
VPLQRQLVEATKSIPSTCMIMYEPSSHSIDDRVDLQYITLLHLFCTPPIAMSSERAGRLMLDCSLSRYTNLLPKTEQMRLNSVLAPYPEIIGMRH